MNISDLDPNLVGKTHTTQGDIRLVNDDVFTWLPDQSIDLVLTDPPFNIARDTNFHTYEGNTINSYRFDAEKGWDSYSPEEFKDLLKRWALEFERVLRPGGSFAIFCADEYLSDLISALKDAKLKPRRTLTWRKPNAVPVNRKHMMTSACEYIVLGVKGSKAVFNADIDFKEEPELTVQEVIAISDKASTIIDLEIRKALEKLDVRPSASQIKEIVNNAIAEAASAAAERSINIYAEDDGSAALCVPNFVNFNSKAGNRLHPTEKPVNLLRYLIELLSKPGDVLLDPFAGSSSLGEAAVISKRSAILVERDKEFYEKGSKRIEALLSSQAQSLFE